MAESENEFEPKLTIRQEIAKLKKDHTVLHERTMVTLKNGEQKTVPVNVAIGEIWEMQYEQKGVLSEHTNAMEIWLDFWKVYKPLKDFFKKYAKVILILLGFGSTIFGGSYVIGLLKHLLGV